MIQSDDFNFVMINPSLVTNVPMFEVFSYEETTTTKIIQWNGSPVHALFLKTETALTSAKWRGFKDITEEFKTKNQTIRVHSPSKKKKANKKK